MGALPDHIAAALDRAFPPGVPKQEDYALLGGETRKQPDRSRPTRPRNRKQFYVRLLWLGDPDAVLTYLWEQLQVPQDPGWHVAGGHVEDGEVHLGVVYVGRGGVPSDIRKILGRKILGVRFSDDQCLIERRGTETLEEDLTG